MSTPESTNTNLNNKSKGILSYTPLMIIILLAGALRFWGIDQVGLWHDEALSHYYSSRSWYWIFNELAFSNNHPPLFFFLLKGWLNVVPTYSQFWVESMNVFFSLGTIVVFYFWAKRLTTKIWALFLIVLLTIHPFHVHYSTELRMYPVALFFVVMSGYYFTILLEDMRGRWHWFFWALWSSLSLYTHSFTGLYVLSMILLLGWYAHRKSFYKHFWLAVAGILLLYMPWLTYTLRDAMKVSSDFWIPPFQLKQLLYLGYWLGGYVSSKEPGITTLMKSLSVCLTFFLPVILSLKKFSNRYVNAFWIVGLGPILMVTFLSLYGQSVFLMRIQIFALPFFLLLLVFGLRELPHQIMLIVIIGFLGFGMVETYLLKMNPPHQYVIDMEKWIEVEHYNEVPIVHAGRFTYFPSIFYHERSLPEYIYGGEGFKSVRADDIERWRKETPVFVVYFRDRLYQAPMSLKLIKKWKKNLAPEIISGPNTADNIKLMKLPKKSS